MHQKQRPHQQGDAHQLDDNVDSHPLTLGLYSWESMRRLVVSCFTEGHDNTGAVRSARNTPSISPRSLEGHEEHSFQYPEDRAGPYTALSLSNKSRPGHANSRVAHEQGIGKRRNHGVARGATFVPRLWSHLTGLLELQNTRTIARDRGIMDVQSPTNKEATKRPMKQSLESQSAESPMTVSSPAKERAIWSGVILLFSLLSAYIFYELSRSIIWIATKL